MSSPPRDFSARKSRGERAGGEAINGLGVNSYAVGVIFVGANAMFEAYSGNQ